VQFSGTAGYTYTAISRHLAIADLSDFYDYYSEGVFYYDYYYFSYFEGQGIYEPWQYYFLSPSIQEIERSSPLIDLGSTYDTALVNVSGQPDVTYTTASIPGAQGNFESGTGIQSVSLNATASQCDPYTDFTLTVNYHFNHHVQEVLDVTAVGFGGNHYAEWYVDDVQHSENLSSDPQTGQAVITVNKKGRGTGTTYNKIRINVKAQYYIGAAFSAPASVSINCP